MDTNFKPISSIGPRITREASKQTYYTIRTLVPRDRQDEAYAAYAYFRWVDDLLDGDALNTRERMSFLNTQKKLLSECLRGRPPRNLSAEERMLVDLTQGALGGDAGLRIYLQDMMAVMEFDAHRRHRRISQRDLTWYSRCLASAVTEAVYTFIGNACGAPRTPERYMAADAAHTVHMLRDLHEDLDAGYINIPSEVLPGKRIDHKILESEILRSWVRERVDIAREYFKAGAVYLSTIENPRCRVAGALYAARFTGVLDAIEREGYRLRPDYSDCKNGRTLLRMAWRGLNAALPNPFSPKGSMVQAPIVENVDAPQIMYSDPLKE